MLPLAKAAGFEPGIHKWKDTERFQLMAELDAAFFLLYGIEREDVIYILSTFQGLSRNVGDLLANPTVKLILEYYDKYRA